METTDIERGKVSVEKAGKGVSGIIVPGGFGERGAEGRISVIQYARDRPYIVVPRVSL